MLFGPLSLCAPTPLSLSAKQTNLKQLVHSSITFELKKQIYFFLVQSDKKISFESFRVNNNN
jgi:hypothetical protein